MSDRLAQMLLMLSSKVDNEVLMAARAVTAELAKMGKDWHWLADKVRPAQRAQSDYAHATRPAKAWDVRADPNQYKLKVEELVATCLDELTTRERQFIEELNERYARHGSRTKLSVQNKAWLDAIYRRHV
jgi:hypothetical protein